jgi:GrpB-like predicted nucleotidyltransferase (UPF0157 family)
MDEGFVEFVDEERVRETVLAVFDDLHATLEKLLPHVGIEHIGSTSVPGAITKGDLDVCVIVERSTFEEADRVLAERFARNDGSDRTESLSSFVDNSRLVPVGVQLVVRGGREDFFVQWRDLLRRSPQLLRTYNELKRRWHGRSHDSYRIEKSKFIEMELGKTRSGQDAG